jgi:photosystem II stability/assembly factor-like uncharacterized protein
VEQRDANDWPEGTINTIDPSDHDPGRAFVVMHRYRVGDFTPYIWKTDDYGKSWTRIADGTNGIPNTHFTRAIQEDPKKKGLLYAGTEFGMYVSFNDGRSCSRSRTTCRARRSPTCRCSAMT